MSADLEQGFDAIVVGGGTAGCVLAARLSEDADRRVCLLEAGGSGRSAYVNIPAAIVMAQRTPRLNWGFQTVPQPHLNGRNIPVPRGRGLGGSSLINGMVWFRGHPLDYDDWARAGATGWSFREVLPYFLRSEDNGSFPDSPWHGRGGPIHVRNITHPNRLNMAFFEAMQSLGYPLRADLAGEDSEGAALRQVSIRDGIRETTARAMLEPARKRANLTVITDARVTRVLLDGRRAIGVEAHSAQGMITVKARGEIVLAAGAIHSPQLLMLSGIGDGEHLRAVGVDVRHHLPGVGGNLHDHLASPVHMATRDATSYGLSWRAMPRNLLNIAQYALNRSGPMANNIFESAAFVRTLPHLDRPDVQLVFQSARRPSPRLPFPVGHGYAISPVGLYPRSRGTLRLASADPMAAPLIHPNLLSVAQDIEPLLRGLQLARRVFASPAFAAYRAQETLPGPSVQDEAQLAEYVRAQAYTVHHPVSSCRMGRDDDADAVVDAQLRVRGIQGLRVADASVFPSIIGGNTNAAVAMVAEKAADMMRGRAAA
ncbi:MAG: GMC family oxidoreductase N-terminal domain-containing protein [Nevskiaceae bacterium]|jgi:choline dehydrogenase-like flavoprotein|nr:GMC family oxidoreductase N-terminal domain-containing protein [Nevskiaceae bacterium]